MSEKSYKPRAAKRTWDKIKVGDLVYVRRWECCGKVTGIFSVREITTPRASGKAGVMCGCCFVNFSIDIVLAKTDSHSCAIAPLSWLRKIPPLAELESVEREAELCR